MEKGRRRESKTTRFEEETLVSFVTDDNCEPD